jgi:hypothetical protein
LPSLVSGYLLVCPLLLVSLGGFTFALDPALGTFVRTTESLGPLFAERAPTLGRGKLNVNVSFTFFEYDEFNGEDLDNLSVVARHDPDTIGFPDVREQFENDIILMTLFSLHHG